MNSPKEMSSKDVYWRLLQYVRPYWKPFLLSLLALVVVALSEPAFPALLKPLLDGSFVSKDKATMVTIPFLIILLFLVRGLASYVSSYAISWVGGKLVMDLRAATFRKLVYMPTNYYDNHSSGTLIAHVAFNVTQVTTAATTAITVLVRDSLTIIGLLGWMLYLNWKLTLVSFLVAPVIMLTVKLMSRRLRGVSRELYKATGQITHVLEEAIECHKVVKIFGGQNYELARFTERINEARRFGMKHISASSANTPIVQTLAAMALAAIIFIATLQTEANETTVGGFVSFITAMLMIFSPLKQLTGVNEALQRGIAAAEVIFEMLDQPGEPDHGTRRIGKARGDVVFRDVCFTYPDQPRPAVDRLNLSIGAGETVALVGQSGSGKTTLVNLLPRFYNPQSGEILLDGIPVSDIVLEDLRANISLVSQDVALFNDTVAANIAYGCLASVSDDRIVAAATAAHAMEFISEMPLGLQTMIGENGVKLSGGQRQRLAIARALLKDAPVLILDEATSALDTESERHVQAALETLMAGRTTIVIAHRLSTIESADRIVVLQKGAIAESGTHHDLLARNGIYANLHRIQFSSPGTPL